MALYNRASTYQSVKDILLAFDELRGEIYNADSRWLAEIFAAMINHKENIKVQEAACLTLSHRLAANPDLTSLIGEGEDHLLPLHLTVLAALNIHANNIYVFRAACEAISEMSIHSKELQQYLYTKGASASIIKEMKCNKGEVEVHGWGCRALRCLALKNPYQEELMFIEDVLSVIYENMKTFREVNVLKENIGLLVCLATDLQIVLRQCMALKIPELILRIMDDKMENAELVETALEAIALFTSSEEQQLLHIDCVRTIRKVLKRHEDNASIQLKGCIITQLINADLHFIAKKDVLKEIIAILTGAIDKHENNLQILTEGCISFYLMFTHSGDKVYAVKKHALEFKMYETLFHIIEHESSKDFAASYARDSLENFCSEQHIKDELLQRACEGDFIKCAEFMICQGASLEAHPLPLCIAVKNRKKKLVEMLLSYDSSNASQALAPCLDDKNYEIAGVLLRYIGFEEESQNLMWGALNIKDLKPEMVYNTLTFQIENRNRSSLRLNSTDRKNKVSKVSTCQGFSTPPQSDSSGSLDSPELNIRKEFVSQYVLDEVSGRNIKTLSGSILPFNQDDPRLLRRGSDAEKHLIPSTPLDKDYTHYPNQPDASPIIGASAGNLLRLNKDRCATPDMFSNRRRKMQTSISETAIMTIVQEGRSRFYTENAIDITPLAKVMKPNSPATPRSRTVSCLTPPKIVTKNGRSIKTLDISCNELTDIKQFLTCPSALISDLLNHLKVLHLNKNLLTKFPKEYCQALPSLKILDLGSNKLTNFPYEILEHQVLETLDLSNNYISDIDETHIQNTLSLNQLDLSYNKLSQFPTWVGDYFQRLIKLSLKGNQIREIPKKASGLRSIKDINLSNNIISRVSPIFFKSCISLEKIDLSNNVLESLPNYAPNTLCRLNQINVSNNRLEEKRPFFIPQFILAIPSLTMVDLSENRISRLPDPHLWCSRGLKELRLQHNRIRKINIMSNSKDFWPTISRLNLSYNRIEEIPSEIGVLDSLVSLDVSHNPFSIFPDEIGKLKKIFELPLDGLKLKHDPASMKGRPQDIITYFRSKLKHAVPYRRIKLMLVGLGGRGKSSLLRQLANLKHPSHNLATVGIELHDWELKPPKIKKDSPTFVMNTWDFAGQEDFYSTHQYFLSSRALYLAVYDASRGKDELGNLRTWLLNIQASAPDAMVVLVGTHSDKIPREGRSKYLDNLCNDINAFVQEPGFPTIQSKYIVNCMKETPAIERLREEIYDIIDNFNYEGQQIMKQSVPRCYVELEDIIRNEACRMAAENILPIKKYEQLLTLSQEKNLIMDEEELTCALKFLKETGSIMNFSDPNGFTSNLYFINPQWLCQMMARVVTIREINPYITPEGILSKKHSTELFPRDVYPQEFLDRYFGLLCKFEIVFPLTDAYLVTARVPHNAPQFIPKLQKQVSVNDDVITRRYIFPYFPNGFWPRLLTRILLFEREKLQTESEPKRKFWKTGIYITWNTSRYFLISSVPELPKSFDIYVPKNQDGFMLLGILVDLIDGLIEEWYPGLMDSSSGIRGLRIQRLAPCVTCLGEDYCHFFTVKDCIAASLKSDMIECLECGPRFIKDVAPDIVFADLDDALVLDSLNIDETAIRNSEREIGSGAFASVYKVTVEGDTLAAKVFANNTPTSANRMLRQEVDILTKLRHPCIIKIIGVCLRPRMLLLEFAPLGNLEDHLKSGRGPLSRGMQHRIALQVVEGLTYLHDRGIVYRDLKPSNVLVFSLSMGIFSNVKLSDYGISQWSSMMGLTAGKGTPGYQAPEITQRNVTYNEKVDIFSFGVTFYEIITGGHHPYGDNPFQSQMDAMVVNNKPMISISKYGCPPWTDMENIIQQCLKANPDKRPKAIDIRKALVSANIVCLKREIAISRDQSIECTTIRRFKEGEQDKLEVWVCSGEQEQSQISWFTLGVIKRQSVQGMIVTEGRILCMESYKKYIIVGTGRGFVIVFDANTKSKESKIKLQHSILSLKIIPTKEQIVVGLLGGDLLVGSIRNLLLGENTLEKIQLNDNMPISPIRCIALSGNRVLCGYGASIVEVVVSDSFRIDRSWKVGTKPSNNVSNIEFTKNYIFVSCREEHQIRVYDNSKHKLTSNVIDCYDLIKNVYKNNIKPRDCRPISMKIVDLTTLWIGCENGQILILDVAKFPSIKTLDIFRRNNSAVRSISVTPRLNGASASIITSGKGFRPWKSSEKTDAKDGREEEERDGYVLVWDAELPKLKKKLMLTEHRKREDKAAQLPDEQ